MTTRLGDLWHDNFDLLLHALTAFAATLVTLTVVKGAAPPQAPAMPQAPTAYTVRDNTPATAPAPRAKANCICGDSCKCKEGTCPGKCPVALTGGPHPKHPTPEGYPPAGKGFHWAKYPSGQWGLVQDGLPDPTPKAEAAPAAPAQAKGKVIIGYRKQCFGDHCEMVPIYAP